MLNPIKENIIFVQGKGGVGKTAFSQALSLALSKNGQQTLFVCFNDPLMERDTLVQLTPTLKRLNVTPARAFSEYIETKLPIAAISRLFLNNKLIDYLSQSAPGIHELVQIGKVWFERLHYSHVVVDMPSSGYAAAMFQSTINFSQLFFGGPLQKDALSMLDTFGDPAQTRHLLLAIPEEMPLQEGLEFGEVFRKLFSQNPPDFILNKRFPKSLGMPLAVDILATTDLEYFSARTALEEKNLALWGSVSYSELPYFPCDGAALVDALARRLAENKWV